MITYLDDLALFKLFSGFKEKLDREISCASILFTKMILLTKMFVLACIYLKAIVSDGSSMARDGSVSLPWLISAALWVMRQLLDYCTFCADISRPQRMDSNTFFYDILFRTNRRSEF